MPDKVTVTPASGKLEFFNDDGTEIDIRRTQIKQCGKSIIYFLI